MRRTKERVREKGKVGKGGCLEGTLEGKSMKEMTEVIMYGSETCLLNGLRL